MLKDITLGQYFPGTSFLHQLDPRCKIIATLIVIVAIFLAESLPAYGLITVFILLCFFISHLPLKLILKSLKPLWVIIILTMGIHVFTTSGTVIWQWGILHITWEGIRQGALMTARLIYLIVFSSLLTYTTSPIVLTDGIEHLLNPFRRVGVPAHELAMMMTIALRFYSDSSGRNGPDHEGPDGTGANFTSGSIMQRGRNMIPLLVPLFVSAFRRADDLATAMEARCYRGGEGRTRMHELAYTFRDTIAMIVVIGLTAVLVAMRWFI